jgi:hypothetical protein
MGQIAIAFTCGGELDRPQFRNPLGRGGWTIQSNLTRRSKRRGVWTQMTPLAFPLFSKRQRTHRPPAIQNSLTVQLLDQTSAAG